MGLEIESIEALDIQTMMAVSSEKYQPIIEELAENPLSVQEVRSRMKSINQEAKKVAPTKSDVIRRDVNGQRYAQIPPVYDQNAISSLARQMSMEGKSAQTIAAEGLLLREKAILALKGLEIPEQLSEAIALILPTEEIVPLIEKEATLVEASPQTWENAQQELAEYIESKSEETAPALKIGDKVSVAGQVGIIVDFEEKPLIDEIHPVISWSGGGQSVLSPRNIKVEEVAASKNIEFALGDKVWYGKERYTVASLPDEDGDILVARPNGTTRFLESTVLQKLE
ncbi:hypothetical protein [Scytonema sp. PCC 10023]|uniref:hypothetical protein n=1 Tax=Scytonema sp. PCC 10023 TaxID=1680591 RepID=UPI0039C6E6DD